VKPNRWQSSPNRCLLEDLRLIRGAERLTCGFTEHQLVVGPRLACGAAVKRLPVLVSAKRGERLLREVDAAAGARGLRFRQHQPDASLPLQGTSHREGSGGPVNIAPSQAE
jgi:hypothetical protein